MGDQRGDSGEKGDRERTDSAKDLKFMWSWGGKNRRICVSEMGSEGYALSRHVAISFLPLTTEPQTN